ncbi:transcriptional regulator [Corynebacterium diphtheriae]|nr:transcriptional regulator [Corynebacterium diphtheriae]
MFLLSLDEIARVKRINRIDGVVDLAEITGVNRRTWGEALKHRIPTPKVLQALAALGARSDRILIYEPQDTAA